MNKNQIFIYNAPKISFVSNNHGDISSENEIKLINKSKLPNKLINKKLNLDKLINNDIDIGLSKKISDNSMNKLNTKRTHLSDELDIITDKEEKKTEIFYNNDNVQENIDINEYKNILIKKTRNQKENIFFDKKKNKNIFNSEIDSINEKMIENNIKTKDNYFKKNPINYFNDIDKSERALKGENGKGNTKKEKTGDLLSKEKNISDEKLYDIITGYNIEQKILYNNLKLFFFHKIPENKTLITNINIRNKEFLNKTNNKNYKIQKGEEINSIDLKENIKTYDFDLEILRNHQIYYFGKVISYLPYVIIKIYISGNFTKYGEISQLKVEESDFFCVGKIESNILRTEFNVYKGNDKIKYEKILNINYNINLFGLFGVRVMTVNKYENNHLSQTFKNELPKWDNEFKLYKLNFNGRVKMICKKNFILKLNEENILQCGKINDNSFALDFISPLSPFESFCISITSLINKKACE